MAQPPTYEPDNFAQKTFDSDILADLNTEFSNIKSFVDAVRVNLAAIQRDDTKLKNSAVHRNALDSEVLALLGASFNPRGAWQTTTEYKQTDVVVHNGETWICAQDHTSGTFSTDQGNNLWLPISTTGGGGDELLTVSTSGTASAYTISTGNAYSDWNNVPPLLVTWHTASAGDATVDVDGLGAKSLKVVGGDNVAANDLVGTDLIVYDSGADAVRVIGREGAAVGSPTVAAAITADKTLTVNDFNNVSHFIQLVDFSAGSGNTIALTLPAASDHPNKLVTLLATADAGQNSANKAQLQDSGAAELATLFQAGDLATFGSDGTNWVFVDEQMTLEIELALTANETIAATSAAKVFDAGVSIDKNIGRFWDGSTNHRLDHPGFADALLVEVSLVRAAHADVSLYPVHSVRGDYLDAAGLAQAASSFDVPGVPMELASGENITLEAYNNNAGGQDLFGDTNKDETRVLIRSLRRLR